MVVQICVNRQNNDPLFIKESACLSRATSQVFLFKFNDGLSKFSFGLSARFRCHFWAFKFNFPEVIAPPFRQIGLSSIHFARCGCLDRFREVNAASILTSAMGVGYLPSVVLNLDTLVGRQLRDLVA